MTYENVRMLTCRNDKELNLAKAPAHFIKIQLHTGFRSDVCVLGNANNEPITNVDKLN